MGVPYPTSLEEELSGCIQESNVNASSRKDISVPWRKLGMDL